MADPINEIMAEALDYLDALLADDLAAQEYAMTACADDHHPALVRELKCLAGYSVRIELGKIDF
jgi:hypothetical protein